MKLHKPDISIESAGIKSTTRFTIEATHQSFSVLSSTIYEDKIKAPIRELSTNAYDAHVEAGCANRPFSVHLPNALDPEFRVRDYGISMSHDQIMTLYTTYFASNKRETNELNGCLGLGSKSPFAYTSQFWVTAYKDGKKRHYVATADVDGPRFDQYPTCDTDEDDGFEVGFTVKEDDFGRFRDTAEEVYKYFKTQPDVAGVDFEHLEPEKEKVAGKFWKYIGKHSNSVAIMGNIGYPIDSSYFEDESGGYWEKRKNKYCQILYSGIQIDFEIGELSMTASREGLEYTDEVIQAIKDKLDVVFVEMQDNINKDFEGCECLYDARVKAAKYTSLLHSLDDFVFPTWQNEQGVTIEVKTSMSLATDCKVSVEDFACHLFTYDSKPRMKRDYIQMKFGENYKIFFNDVKIGGQAATKYYVENNPDDIVYLFQNATDETFLKLAKEFGIDESRITRTSQLEKRPRTKVAGTKQPRRIEVDVFTFDAGGSSYQHTSLYDGRYWTPSTKDISKEKENIYVELYRYATQGHGEFSGVGPRTLCQLKTHLEKIGIKMPKVYGFAAGKAKRVKKAKNWVHLMDWMMEKFNQYIDSSDISSMIQNDNILSKMDIAEGMIKVLEMTEVPLLDGYFKKVADSLAKIKKNSAKEGEEEDVVRSVKYLAGHLDSELPEFSVESWNHREERLMEKYPVLRLYDLGYAHRIDEEEATAIATCINNTEIARVAKDLV